MTTRFLLALILLTAFTIPASLKGQGSQSVTDRNWTLSFSGYSPCRLDYYDIPVALRVSGGKLGPREKTKMFVSGIANRANEPIKAVSFNYYLFNNENLDRSVANGPTELMDVSIDSNASRDVNLLVVYLEEIPLLRDQNPRGHFHLEVGIDRIVYADGSAWQANGPQAMDHHRPNCRSLPDEPRRP